VGAVSLTENTEASDRQISENELAAESAFFTRLTSDIKIRWAASL